MTRLSAHTVSMLSMDRASLAAMRRAIARTRPRGRSLDASREGRGLERCTLGRDLSETAARMAAASRRRTRLIGWRTLNNWFRFGSATARARDCDEE
jgi:hypothetical protein